MGITNNTTFLKIETSRLTLFPLNYGQLKKFLNNNLSLEKELGLALNPRILSEKLEEILEEEMSLQVLRNTEKFYFYTLWLIIRNEDQTIVGDINCKGEKSISGEVEIGYETIDEFQNQGYMSEAVSSFSEWLLSLPGIFKVFAITDDDNFPSIAVMKKNNFQPFYKAGNLIKWEKASGTHVNLSRDSV